MPLKSDLENLQYVRNVRRTCLINTILESLQDQDRQALLAALSNLNISGSQISRILNSNNIVVGVTTVNKHRKNDCCCHESK